MLGHKLGIANKNNIKLIPPVTTLWLLNADATHVVGKNYVWFDASVWADARAFKG